LHPEKISRKGYLDTTARQGSEAWTTTKQGNQTRHSAHPWKRAASLRVSVSFNMAGTNSSHSTTLLLDDEIVRQHNKERGISKQQHPGDNKLRKCSRQHSERQTEQATTRRCIQKRYQEKDILTRERGKTARPGRQRNKATGRDTQRTLESGRARCEPPSVSTWLARTPRTQPHYYSMTRQLGATQECLNSRALMSLAH
jgi:hypothetical protein